MENFDFSEMANAVNSVHAEFEAARSVEAEYQAELDASIFETCEILHRMEEESKKAAVIDQKRFIIQTVIGVAALIAAVVAAVGTLIQLLG